VAEAVAFEAKVAIPPLSPVSKPITSSINIEEKVQLGGMDEAERLASSQGESDLLDIPAFLRRQAN
jgi:cell division protein FtsZ